MLYGECLPLAQHLVVQGQGLRAVLGHGKQGQSHSIMGPGKEMPLTLHMWFEGEKAPALRDGQRFPKPQNVQVSPSTTMDVQNLH
jgi:hypothetical protein